MATSTAQLANRALRHLGVKGRITTLSSDTTAEGAAIRDVYDEVVKATLTEANWVCARKEIALTLVETIADSDTREWLYAYRLPYDCLAPRRLLWAGIRNPRAEQEVPFDTAQDTDATAYAAGTTYSTGAAVLSSGIWYIALRETIGDTPASSTSDWVAVTGGPPKLLYTDEPDAVLEYTQMLSDCTRFDDPLDAAIAARLAFEIAPSVTVNGSVVDLRAQTAAIWEFNVNAAKAKDYHARQHDLPPVSGYQAARSYRSR